MICCVGNSTLTLCQKGKILEVTKLKAFADDKLNSAKMMISLFDRVENTVGKGENAGYQHFLLFPQSFPKRLCGEELTSVSFCLWRTCL